MNRKTLYIVGGSVVGLLLGFMAYKLVRADKKRDRADVNDENLNIPDNESSNEVVIDNLPTGQQSSQGAKPSDDGFPMRAGKYGYKVYLLQSALNKLGASLTLDGKFGQATYDAITDYGDLPFYDWNFGCNFQYIELCVITKQKWDKILSNAKKQGWNEQQAKEDASKNWLEFSGSKQKFSNIEI